MGFGSSTNLDGFYNVMRSVLFSMLRVKRGRIVAVSSASGQTGHPGQVNYSAAKYPVILPRTPYNKLRHTGGRRLNPIDLAYAGYARVVQDVVVDVPEEAVAAGMRRHCAIG